MGELSHFSRFPLSTDKRPSQIREAPVPATFLVEPLLLIQDDQLTVLVRLLQYMLALLDVAVVVLQAQQRGHQGHVRLQRKQDFHGNRVVKGDPHPRPPRRPSLLQAGRLGMEPKPE